VFIYCPINLRGPIATKKPIYFQNYTFDNYPDIIVELHDNKYYIDLGDNCYVAAAVTNTDLMTTLFTGNIKILNPHRGQIRFSPSPDDFLETGINTITVRCFTDSQSFSFQFTVFVQSLSSNLYKYLVEPYKPKEIKASDVKYDNTGSGLQASNVQDALDELKSMTHDVETTEVTIMLYANQWNNGIYIVTCDKITAESDVYVGIPRDITKEQYDAIAYANIIQTDVEEGKVTLSPLHGAPTIDVPISLVIKTRI
jgi:hypothetical protein